MHPGPTIADPSGTAENLTWAEKFTLSHSHLASDLMVPTSVPGEAEE